VDSDALSAAKLDAEPELATHSDAQEMLE